MFFVCSFQHVSLKSYFSPSAAGVTSGHPSSSGSPVLGFCSRGGAISQLKCVVLILRLSLGNTFSVHSQLLYGQFRPVNANLTSNLHVFGLWYKLGKTHTHTQGEQKNSAAAVQSRDLLVVRQRHQPPCCYVIPPILYVGD